MKIVCDSNILLAKEFFASLGELELVEPRELSASRLQRADVLIVRSMVRIDSAMLANTPVKFVGTCTAGIDHLDTEFMDKKGIAWAGAPGCNADAVVDYVFSCLTVLQIPWWNLQVGIVACGNVGSRLLTRLTRLGVVTKVYDPLLPQHSYLSLTTLDAVMDCDIVCVHAPLTTAEPHASYHLLNESRLARLRPQATLISAGRGAVVDNNALKQLLKTRADLKIALDVWEGEPRIDIDLLRAVNIATPHIAGHSYDGKVKGTEIIYKTLCKFMGVTPTLSLDKVDTRPQINSLVIEGLQRNEDLSAAILQAYDVATDSQQFKAAMLNAESTDAQTVFDGMRKQYGVRREFAKFQVRLADGQRAPNQSVLKALTALGFEC